MRNKMLVLILAMVFLFAGTAFAQTMSGTYYVGNTGTAPGATDPHYATLNAACEAVMAAGVGGDILFLITSDLTEPDNVDLAVNTGEFSITFKPFTGITPTVTYTQAADNAGSSGAWVIGMLNTSGAPFVPTNNIMIDGSNAVDGTTRDLSFVSSTGTNAYAFRIKGNCDNITIKNCNMTVTTASYGIWVNSQDNAIPDSLTIENNFIQANSTTTATPVHVSYSGTITEPLENLVVRNNHLVARTRGVFLNGNTNVALIEGNTVEVNQTASGYVSSAVMGNKIFSTGTTYILGNDFKVNATVNTAAANGIRTIVASGGGTFIVANNFFRGFAGPSASGTASEMIGIRCGSPVEAYYNTFVLNNIDATTGTLYRAINVAAGTPTIMNNIFVIEEDDFPAYAISGAPVSNYNNFYLAGTTNAKAHPTYATLADLQAAGMDTNSVSKAVEFAAADDLHLAGVSVDDFDLAGTPIAGITTDIDGDVRGDYPYMGADEASVALEPPAPDPVIFANNFVYTDGTLLTAEGWTAHSAAGTNAITVNAPALSFEGYLGGNEGGAAELFGPSGEDINKTFTEQNAGSVYTAFLVNVTEASEAGDYFLHVAPTTMGSTYRGRIFVKRDASNNLAFGASKSGSNIVYSNFDYALNTTYLIVMKYTMVEGDANDEIVLWVNPEGDTEPAALLSQTDTGSDAANIGTVALRQGGTTTAAKLRLDGLRLGTDWAAVVGDPVAPEPPVLEDPADFFIPKGSHEKGWATLKEAVDSINANGVVGTINLLLDADTLREESFTFNAPLDAVNNVVVKPAPGRDVVLIVTPGLSKGNGIQMIGFDKGYVTFDGSNDGSNSRNLLVTTETNDTRVPFGLNSGNADNVVIKNLEIVNIDHPAVTVDFRYGLVINDLDGVSGLVVENCQIGSAERPIRRDGLAPWGGSGAEPHQFSFIGNEIYAGIRGITTIYLANCEIIGNTINILPATAGPSGTGIPPTSSDAYNHGIYITGHSGTLLIEGNKINMPEKVNSTTAYLMGIAFAGNGATVDDQIYIINNFLNIGAADETRDCFGIGLRSTQNMGNIKAYHNTIVVNQTASTLVGYGVGNRSNGTGPVNLDLKNNIVINNHTGNLGSAAIGVIPATSVLTSDYNVLVSDSVFANLMGTTYADLAAWQAAGQDAGSVSKAVTFAGAADLHLAAPSYSDLDLVMPKINDVDVDIDGDARGHILYSYAGADEGTAYPLGNDLELTFDDATDVSNWSHWDEANGWTVEAWAADSTLRLSDAGYSMIAKRPVSATPGWMYKLSIDIKTGNWEGKALDLSVQGLGNDLVKKSIVSDDVWTTFTFIGVADAEDGYIRIVGSGNVEADTVFVDNVIWDDLYLEVVPSATVRDVRGATIGDYIAASGVVTTTTEYGTAGPVYIQDGTAGIAVYKYDVAQNVVNGDEILVVGKLKDYNGLLEFDPVYDYIVLSKDNVVEPTVITALDMEDRETYEGMLVTIEKVDTLETGLSWASTAGMNKGFSLKDKNDSTFYCYIDKDTDIDGSPKPTEWPLNISGIMGDYNGAQLLPRSLADFAPANNPPAAFTWVNPPDETVITSLEDPNFHKVLMGADSVLALLMNWTTAVDDDTEDTVTYQIMISPDGPEEDLITQDTFMYMPVNTEKPWDMNGTYEAYVIASDLLGETTHSDTITITFDFQAPPVVVYSDIVLVDGAPKFYAKFNMPIAPEVANFKLVDWSDGAAASNATAITYAGGLDILVSGAFVEDHWFSLAYSGVPSAADSAETPLTVVDTTKACEVLIPFSANHPEDVTTIETFESGVGLFKNPTYSGSTVGLLTTSTFESSADAAYRGTKSGKLNLLDDPAGSGWYLRLYHGLTYSVNANSKLMFLVKGTNANVEMRISVKDTGYEQGPWKMVSLSETDWQVVSFDLANDVAEGWITGNGLIEGTTLKIEALHMRCAEDADVVLYIDEFTERKVLSPVDVTLNVIMKKQVADGKFALATDFVDVAGSMNGWGGTTMADFDADTTYSVTLPLMPYSSHEFKFRINGSWSDATCEFPSGGPNRQLTVGTVASEHTYWYNDDTLEVAVDGIPVEFALHQNYPNPFNPTTTINFDLPADADVKLVIYDITGRTVRTLVSGSITAGYKKIVWNGRDDFGRGVATGMYIYRLVAGDFVDVKKMTFLK